MKNIFERTLKKGNPFMTNKEDKGDDVMNEETETIKDNEGIEEETVSDEGISDDKNTENSEDVENTNQNEIESDKSEYDKIKEDFNNLNNQYLRLAADFDNYRKRQAQEREALIRYGAEECMKKIIEVADNFDRAITMVEKIDNLDKMKETFMVLNKQLTESLTKIGLEKIKTVGEPFDPTMHEAVMQTQTDEYPEDTVITEMQKGYKYGDKVIRPAMVSVAVK